MTQINERKKEEQETIYNLKRLIKNKLDNDRKTNISRNEKIIYKSDSYNICSVLDKIYNEMSEKDKKNIEYTKFKREMDKITFHMPNINFLMFKIKPCELKIKK